MALPLAGCRIGRGLVRTSQHPEAGVWYAASSAAGLLEEVHHDLLINDTKPSPIFPTLLSATVCAVVTLRDTSDE